MDNTIDAWWVLTLVISWVSIVFKPVFPSESRYLYRSNVTNSYWRYFFGGVQNDQLVAVGGLYELSQIVRNVKKIQ